MSQVKRIISDISFTIASTGNPISNIKFEDQHKYEQPIQFIGDDSLKFIISTKDIGDELTVVKSGKWMNIVPDDSKTSLKKLFANFTRLLNNKNEDRAIVSKDFMLEEFGIWLVIDSILYDYAKNFYINDKSEFAKEIVKNLELTVSKQTMNPIEIIRDSAREYRRLFEKKYIACLETEALILVEEHKSKSKPKSKTKIDK
ncbi:MAG: hypothetical protein GQ557_01880 [Mycoplasmataceae bacterium]|nr:hypothetical protein [Mycoplasmataceae bacterium]